MIFDYKAGIFLFPRCISVASCLVCAIASAWRLLRCSVQPSPTPPQLLRAVALSALGQACYTPARWDADPHAPRAKARVPFQGEILSPSDLLPSSQHKTGHLPLSEQMSHQTHTHSQQVDGASEAPWLTRHPVADSVERFPVIPTKQNGPPSWLYILSKWGFIHVRDMLNTCHVPDIGLSVHPAQKMCPSYVSA